MSGLELLHHASFGSKRSELYIKEILENDEKFKYMVFLMNKFQVFIRFDLKAR